MTDAPIAIPQAPDAAVVLRQAMARLADSIARAHPQHAIADPRTHVLRLLDLRCKLEQLVVLPVLHTIGALGDEALHETGRELAGLRTRLGVALEHPAPEAEVLLSDDAARHFARVDRVLADPRLASVLDDQHLADEIVAWTERWCDEITRTGDIEDEERDPVGTPPR